MQPGMRPGMTPPGDGTPPEMPEGERPEMPEGMTPPEGQTPPGMPEGERPEMPGQNQQPIFGDLSPIFTITAGANYFQSVTPVTTE